VYRLLRRRAGLGNTPPRIAGARRRSRRMRAIVEDGEPALGRLPGGCGVNYLGADREVMMHSENGVIGSGRRPSKAITQRA
jgi:hypothetical protein